MAIFNFIREALNKKKSDWQDELLVIKNNILDEIGSQVRELDDRSYFRHSLINIQIHAENDDQFFDYEESFKKDQVLEKSILDYLARKKGVKDLSQLKVILDIVRAPSSEWEDRKFHIHYERGAQGKTTAPLIAQRGIVSIVRGQTGQTEYLLSKKTFIGRSEEVISKNGRFIRRNNIVFLDNANEINSSVARMQARIEFDEESNTYRLYDEDSKNGTRIDREGRVISVEAIRGSALKNDDIVYFGRAMARFNLKPSNQ